MRIEPARSTDLAAVHLAYAHGRARQQALGTVVWPPFADAQILAEIERRELFGVWDADALVGVFSLIEDDALIWGELERGAHLYLHRIARAPARAPSASARGLMDGIVAWSHARATAAGRVGLRMDTWASNDVLLAYYATCGFHLIGTKRLPDDPRLSAHYHGIELALLEAVSPSAP